MSDLQSYLFAADTTQASFRSMLDAVDSLTSVKNWQKILPAAAVLVSAKPIEDLHDELKQALPGQRYILVELERGKKNGWLPGKVWDFMNQPAPV